MGSRGNDVVDDGGSATGFYEGQRGRGWVCMVTDINVMCRWQREKERTGDAEREGERYE